MRNSTNFTLTILVAGNKLYIYIYIYTGKHLSEHCKREYPNSVNYLLWMIAEIAVIAADIPEGEQLIVSLYSSSSSSTT